MFKAKFVPFFFLAPSIIMLSLFKLWPIYASFFESFRFTPISGESVFVGLENYEFLFRYDPVFWNSMSVTLRYNFLINPLNVLLALVLALLLNRPQRYIAFFRSVYFLPSAISFTVVAVIWGVMLDHHYGLLNSFLSLVGLPGQGFFSSPGQALPSLVAVSSWRSVGYWMMFFLAGLQSIPQDVYEAAWIDGANGWKQTILITLPLLKRTTAFVLIANVAFNFLTFAPVFVLTRGGPRGATNLLMYESYKSAFINLDMGRATAISSILLLVILLFAVINLRVTKAEHEY